jgi:HJR/Mrr/RecB family endonuclease
MCGCKGKSVSVIAKLQEHAVKNIEIKELCGNSHGYDCMVTRT